MFVEIIYTPSGRGLVKDADLLKDTIRFLGHDVSVRVVRTQNPVLSDLSCKWGGAKKRFLPKALAKLTDRFQIIVRRLLHSETGNADLIIHLENIHPHHISTRSPNWLIPNQEWFRPERTLYLKYFDRVLCKTITAKECFQPLHHSVHYLGFSAPLAMNLDELPLTRKKPVRILHVAGASLLKGTEAVLAAWKRNSHWPTLTLIANIPGIEKKLPGNVELKSNVREEELQALWQEAIIAVIPSEVEGYGQVIAEAMCLGAVIITTDAPPMNELVNADRGYLVPYSETERFRLGTRYRVSIADLERAVNAALEDSSAGRPQKASNARDWARANHKTFISQLGYFLDSLTPVCGNDQSIEQTQTKVKA